jgi:hypothetical protein
LKWNEDVQDTTEMSLKRFLNKNSIFIRANPKSLVEIKKQSSFEYGAFPLPPFKNQQGKGVSTLEGFYLSMNAYSKKVGVY